MSNKERLEKFYADVEALDLKFPVAAIASKTGFSKGNVSVYLSKKKEPSDSFLKRFYKEFSISSTNVPRETNEEPDLKQIMRMQNALIQELAKHSHTQNVILAEIKEGIQDKVKAIDSNLKTALGGVEQLSLHVESARVVILDSLSRLEKRPGSLKDEADKIVVRLMKERSKQGNVAASGR